MEMKISRVLLLDYSKAFDLVDHNILVKGCTAMMFLIFLCIGLAIFCLTEGSVCELIKNYQDWPHVNGSVVQGSWPGPLLFVIMINDLQARDLLHKYIDDSTVTEEVSNPADSHLQEYTDNFVQWSDYNHMKINGKKTKEMLIRLKKKVPQFISPLKINFIYSLYTYT